MSDELMSEALEAKLAEIGVHLLTIPPPSLAEQLRIDGWRAGIERYGQHERGYRIQ